MSVSKSKKDKLDLSKLSARELLLIGENPSFLSQSSQSPSSSKGKWQSTGSKNEESDDTDVMSGSSDDSSDDDSSDNSNWEEVNDQHVEAELKRYDSNGIETGEGSLQGGSQLSSIPETGLEIVIPREGVFRNPKKTSIDDYLRREMNRERTELQELMHEVSLLCQIARGLQLSKAISSPLLRDAIQQRVTKQKHKLPGKRLDLLGVEKILKWFPVNMVIYKPSLVDSMELSKKFLSDEEFLVYQIMETTAVDANNMVMIFAALLRFLNYDVRLVLALNPIPRRPPRSELCIKPKSEESRKKKKESKNKETTEKVKDNKNKKSPEKVKDNKKPQSKNKGRKMISSSEDELDKSDNVSQSVKIGQDLWVEVYLNEEERWVSVDVHNKKVICDKQLEVEATKPITYIIGIDNAHKIKDITRRYASEWLTATQKLRVKTKWWDYTLKLFRGKQTARDREEDEYLDEHIISLPMPKSMSEVKNHPLYTMRRQLLKFEALYPPDPPSAGSIKNEPIYSREFVHTLHTRELWLRQAKVVRIGEEPYKVVKARPKYDKITGARMPQTLSELFGEWQTEDYIPPIAQNGKVPRNEWGNVELFHEKLLPQGCVHLRLPGLQRIAKKLDIDCAPAVVGFDFGSMGSRPAFEGFVVCEEFKETLLDAWNEDQEEKKKRQDEKRLQRIYGNWRRLTKGLLIRARLEQKYSINLSGKRKQTEISPPSEASTSKRAKK